MSNENQATYEVTQGPRIKIARTKPAGRKSRYPWDQLKPPYVQKNAQGEEETVYSQFFIEGRDAKKFASQTSSPQKKYGIKLSTRAGEKDGVSGTWVQRVG